MNKRKWEKLKRNPKAFFLDSKMNIFRFFTVKSVERHLLKEEKIKKTNYFNGVYCMLKPIRSDDFNFEYLVEQLQQYNVKGVYIKPLHPSLKSALCILKSDRTSFFKEFVSFLSNEGINLAYKCENNVKRPQSVQAFWQDTAHLKNFDVRLSTNRVLGEQNSSFWFRLEFLEEESDFILFPTANYVSRRLWKHTIAGTDVFRKGLHDYRSVLNKPFAYQHRFDVDVVFTWVNSDDTDWQKLYAQYKPDFNSDATSTSRFYSRDELKYALRSWEKYGNFVRKIFVVSNCAPPAWLNLENPKIEWIWHEKIMPKEVLPTFSSHAIETSLFRIPGLSNYFIYSNDDFLLVRPLTVENFYYHNGIAKLRLENWGNVNGEVTEGEPDYLNGARNANALLEQEFGLSTTQLHTHSPQSMRVDVLQEMYGKYGQHFDETMSHKFRTKDDIAVTGYFYHHYALLSGRALQSTDKTELVQQNHPNFQKKLNNIVKLNMERKYDQLPLSVCVNDGADSHLNETWNIEVMKFLDALFPQKSTFEK